MNMWRPVKARELTAEVAGRRRGASKRSGQIVARASGQGGPFLFGAFGAADAMYAPVVSRFHTYAIAGRPGGAAAIWQAVMALPAWEEWRAGGAQGALGHADRRGRLADVVCRNVNVEA